MTVKTYGTSLLPERLRMSLRTDGHPVLHPERSRMSARTAGRSGSRAKNRHSGRLFLFCPSTSRYACSIAVTYTNFSYSGPIAITYLLYDQLTDLLFFSPTLADIVIRRRELPARSIQTVSGYPTARRRYR